MSSENSRWVAAYFLEASSQISRNHPSINWAGKPRFQVCGPGTELDEGVDVAKLALADDQLQQVIFNAWEMTGLARLGDSIRHEIIHDQVEVDGHSESPSLGSTGRCIVFMAAAFARVAVGPERRILIAPEAINALLG